MTITSVAGAASRRCRTALTARVVRRSLASLLTLVALTAAPAALHAQMDVLTNRYDGGRSGANLNETALTPAKVDVNHFGKLYSYPVDGAVYAQPLYAMNIMVNGAAKNVLFVVTMNDKVYAFDADSASPSALWMTDFTNPPSVTAVPITDIVASGGNIYGNVGIESTPVIDRTAGTLYLVARTKENGNYVQRLHALDITTGADRPGSPVTITASAQGSALDATVGPNGQIVTFNSLMQQQRAALALTNGVVLVAWAGHEDKPPYHGWIMGFDAATLVCVGVFSVTPDVYGGGIWQGSRAPTLDAAGNAYFATGNGAWDGARNWGDSLLKFSVSRSGLTLIDYFTPGNESTLDLNDDDLSGSGFTLLPGTNLLLGGGKEGVLYLLDANNLGGKVTGDAQAVQKIPVNGGHVMGGPVFWNSPSSGPLVYNWSEEDVLTAYNLAGGLLRPYAWGQVTSPGHPGGSLTVSANGSTAQTGIVWASMPTYQSAKHVLTAGTLRAYNAETLQEIWTSDQNPARDRVGTLVKFVPALVANGRVYVPTQDNSVNVYGLLGSAAAPALSASPNALTFPSQPVGSRSATQTVTLNSGGGAPLMVQSMTLSGSNAGDFAISTDACTGVTLAVGSTCAIGITFQPTAAATRNGLLMMATNAPGSPHSVTLTGTGGGAASSLPAPWLDQDIGSVGSAGDASYLNGTFTVEGAGADIWNASDGFHYVYQPLTGDGSIIARVVTIENTAAWTKMGVMIRGALTPPSAYGFMLVSSGKGTAFQRRTADGALAVSTSAAGTAPKWVRIDRNGTTITASVSDDGQSWTKVGQDTITLQATAYVGLVAHSHDPSQLATATFDNVTVAAATTPPAGLPRGWSSADVGATGAAGQSSFTNGTFTVTGSGADVWGTTDAFQYAYRPLSGDGTIVARVATIQNVNSWTKAGVMIRSAASPSAAQAFMLVAASPGKGAPFQRRTADGSVSVSTPGPLVTAPLWVKLVRTGDVITASQSADGVSWSVVGSDTFTMPVDVLVGLAVSSHVSGTPATATFDNVSVTSAPGRWADADVGAPGAPGGFTQSNGTFSVTGAGADVWGTADAFHYAYATLSGDGSIVARVASIQNVNAWTKAGVMIRGSLSAASAQGFMLVAASAAKGAPFQRRVADGNTSSSTPGPLVTAPLWVKLVRSGNVIAAYQSADGAAWTQVGSDTFAMAPDALVGLAVSSHVSGVTATATFDHVSVTSNLR